MPRGLTIEDKKGPMKRCSASAVIVAAADVLIDALEGLAGLTGLTGLRGLVEDLFRGHRLARTAITRTEFRADPVPTIDSTSAGGGRVRHGRPSRTANRVSTHPLPTSTMPYAISASDVRDAARCITGQTHRTPVVTCGTLDQMAGCRLFFKCDQFQRGGAFKFRGAYHAVSRLSDEEAERGVVTHSSGNHAQAVALAARMRGIPARIVMPSSAPPVKKRAVEGYGAGLIECEPTLAAREATASAVLDETGAIFIHPYDNAHVMAGQGTAALELLQDVPDLDALLVPVGGGGLLGGCTIIARDLRPGIRVFAAEPSGADDAARSKRAGRRIPQTAPDTVADGLRSSVGERNWPILRDLVDDVLTVDDDAIIRAMRMLFERAKLLVEASAAVPLAAVLSSAHRGTFEGKERLRVGIVLSGGNQDLDRLPWLA